MISRRHLAEVIGERTLQVHDSKKLAKAVAAYLLDTHDTDDLESLIRDIMEYRAQHGVVEAVAVSAHDLSDDVIRDLEAILKKEHPKAKSVHIISRKDPSVVGGVRLQMANEQLDLTIKDRLDAFKRLTANIKE
ncbi:MAG TPA: F0F1 ATP synthase subunit delta [Candidatus Limnocylindria bacterium]|nr:F0F1 ATP synthase subunit delta [Candidatus Limnocylindria bacterium]